MQYTLALPLSPDATFDNYVGMARRKLDDLSEWNLVLVRRALVALIYYRRSVTKKKTIKTKIEALPGELGRLAPAVLKDLKHFRDLFGRCGSGFGQPDWEEALFHLLNACKDWGSKLVLR